MNVRIERLRAEREKNDNKIRTLSGRNRKIDEEILRIENGEIVGLVRATGMDLDELAAYLKAFRTGETPFVIQKESEDTINENED